MKNSFQMTEVNTQVIVFKGQIKLKRIMLVLEVLMGMME
jgi:hypothetical protein